MIVSEMKINSLAPWFGNNRMLAKRVGVECGKCDWCGVPFCGGAPELPHIECRSGLASDLHRHVINLCRVVSDDVLVQKLVQIADMKLFHPDELAAAQRYCIEREAASMSGLFGGGCKPSDEPDEEWAAAYLAACWMGRGGHAGKKTEFTQNLAARYTASGGGSAIRYRNMIRSLLAWSRALRRWEFVCEDVFDFLDKSHDRDGHALYVDAPWPEAGIEYKHSFSDQKQRQLASRLAGLKHMRVVVRFGDHPLIREMYPESNWNWIDQISRDQQNGEVSEFLIVNGRSYLN